jgi:protocatechuate 3,4-dioxygenase beta subunit
MRTRHLRRRDLLLQCAALGSLTIAPSISLAECAAWWEERERDARKPTAWDELGPFYKREAPRNLHLRGPSEPGLPLTVSGLVYDTRGSILPDAKIEIWHADHSGRYDLDGYRYRSTLIANDAGKYLFDSVMPGHYPGRVCQHIHYLVTAAGCKQLITQLYFATDSAFEGNPDRNYTRDPVIQSRELVRPVLLTARAQETVAAVTFELVLERL